MIDFDDLEKKRFDYKIILVVIAAFLFAIYIYNLMFGSRSYTRLLNLQNQYKTLQKSVKNLKNKNQKLQKQYFELKELEGGE